MAKKDSVEEKIIADDIRSATVNPLLVALAENDKRNDFHANVKTAFMKTGFPLFDYYFGSVINIHDSIGNIIKQEPRIGQAAGTFNLVIGNTGSGKAQPLSTRIPTPYGYRLMVELRIGDKIFGSGGNVISVVGIYPQGNQRVYKITFEDGRTAMSTADHLWTVVDSSEYGSMKTMRLQDIIDGIDNNGNVYKIPTLSGAVQYKHRDTRIDPYTFGSLISSCITVNNSVSIHYTNFDMAEVIGDKLNLGVEMDEKRFTNIPTYHFIDRDTGKKVTAADIFGDIIETSGKRASDIKIPDEYLLNDEEGRYELLRGMMDTAGTFTYDFNDSEYITYYIHGSEIIKHQMIELVRSLGFNAKLDVDPHRREVVSLIVPNELKPKIVSRGYMVKLADSAKNLPDRHDYDVLQIDKIEYSHDEECQCIKVSASDELYVTDQFIVTHNTTLVSQIAANIIRQYPFGHVIHFDCENRYDMSRCESVTKLPSSYFDGANGPERYMIKSERVSLEVIQEMIVRLYAEKVKLKDVLMVETPYQDEFQRPIKIYQPTVIIIDSLASVMKEVFNPENSREVAEAEKMRSNTDGARDAKTLKGFLNDVIPLCKEANITIYGINHINQNIAMSAFQPVAKQQNYLKQDESIPGGRSLVYYAQNIVKLVAHPSDKYTEETDGFNGYTVMLEPIKSSSNQSGNNSYGISFELVFSQKGGFDSLRSLIMYGRDYGLIEGNKPRLKFKDDPSFTFSWKNLYTEADEKPIWENVNKFIVPTLQDKLSFLDPIERKFDMRALDY